MTCRPVGSAQRPTAAPPRNPVARAMAARNGAGKHIRSQGAQRRADRVALQQLARACPRGGDDA